ncbi:MAG: possible lyase, partial [uncultured Solirubrobacteraceae bacterium]
GLEARARGGSRLRRRSRQGLLHRAGRLQRRPRPTGQRRVALRAAHAAGLGLLDRDRHGDHRCAAGLCAGHAARRHRHRGGARPSRPGGGRGGRGPGLPVGPVRLLQRPRRQRLGGAADPAALI